MGDLGWWRAPAFPGGRRDWSPALSSAGWPAALWPTEPSRAVVPAPRGMVNVSTEWPLVGAENSRVRAERALNPPSTQCRNTLYILTFYWNVLSPPFVPAVCSGTPQAPSLWSGPALQINKAASAWSLTCEDGVQPAP